MKNSVGFFCQLFLFVYLFLPVSGWWPFKGAKVTDPPTEVKDENGKTTGEFLRNSPVPFEMSVAEQKFLAEAQRYMGDISALDQCHQVIITRLRSCHELGEEDVGKLAVALFNCQSKAEGRTLYYCSEEMSLKDCTSAMDPDAWNAYHIISNRARSVCYATRNQQFRLKTEYLVNRLAVTAGDQMDFLEKLKDGQERLQDVTKGTLLRLKDGHKNLIQEHVRIRSEFNHVNNELTSKMTENMAALSYEKRIIKEAEQQLSSMSKAIASTLESTTDELKKQDERRKEEHAAVVVDLEEIKTKTMDTWDKIDEKTNAIHEHQEESLKHHVDIIDNLQKLNDTIGFLLTSIGGFENRFDLRLSWLADQFGGTGDKITTLTTCFCHFLYFILMTVCVLFLNAPPLSRVVVLIMVPFNAWAEIKLATSMSYITMTVLILAVVIGHYVIEVTQQNILKEEEKKEKSLRPSQQYVESLGLPAPDPIRPCTPVHCTAPHPFYTSYQASPLPKSSSWQIYNRSSTPTPGSNPHQTSSVTFDPVETENAKRELNLTTTEHSFSLTSTPSKRSLASSKRCGGKTKFGSACKKRVSKTVLACDLHR